MMKAKLFGLPFVFIWSMIVQIFPIFLPKYCSFVALARHYNHGADITCSGKEIHVFDTVEVICKTRRIVSLVCESSGKWESTDGLGCQPMEVLAGKATTLTIILRLLVTPLFIIVLR